MLVSSKPSTNVNPLRNNFFSAESSAVRTDISLNGDEIVQLCIYVQENTFLRRKKIQAF